MLDRPTFIFVEGVGRVKKSEEALFKVDMDEYMIQTELALGDPTGRTTLTQE